MILGWIMSIFMSSLSNTNCVVLVPAEEESGGLRFGEEESDGGDGHISSAIKCVLPFI